jgi:phosphoadenosine phosphosulfate reductase
VIAWALASFDKLVMTSGFNLNGIVLIDMAVKAGYRGDVLFVDTGYHFKETLDTRDSLSARYPELNFITLSAKRPDDQMYAYDTDRCCALRKVAPLENFLEDLQPDAILSARSREQTESRKHLPFVDGSAARATVNPLIHWTQEMLEAYAKEHELAVNPLYWEGFLSIGCWPCTRAVRPGEDARAGRWAGLGKTECGLWTDQGSQAV